MFLRAVAWKLCEGSCQISHSLGLCRHCKLVFCREHPLRAMLHCVLVHNMGFDHPLKYPCNKLKLEAICIIWALSAILIKFKRLSYGYLWTNQNSLRNLTQVLGENCKRSMQKFFKKYKMVE
uniref:Uncharacterized protein n=1 Tax=Anguilla anguilla TaxID=7936 RepID=A0A0E9WEI0_ANGAN